MLACNVPAAFHSAEDGGCASFLSQCIGMAVYMPAATHQSCLKIDIHGCYKRRLWALLLQDVGGRVTALNTALDVLTTQVQDCAAATSVLLPARLSEVEQRVQATAQTCADAVKVRDTVTLCRMRWPTCITRPWRSG